ncbi:MAG TPA: hypothetical protein VF209_00320 [Patescibacteria group bacterium]
MFWRKVLFPLLAYFLLLSAYSLFSYSLTAPNLILTSWPPYWNFQLYMWRTFFNNRVLLSQVYLMLVGAIVFFYLWWGTTRPVLVDFKTPHWKKWLLVLLLVTIPLLASNNALSYDVFNYIFNAKMVAVYHANPHLETATNYLYDDWTRFMHNTHTPAPYGYGWTLLSLLPYSLGGGKFLLTWLSFRLFSLLSLLLLALTYLYALRKKLANVAVVWLILLNPLLLIEIISNSHNDLWMMVPAVWSLLLVSSDAQPIKGSKFLTTGLSLILLALATSIKLATITLLPLWLALVIWDLGPIKRVPLASDLGQFLIRDWPFWASILMFIPLLTLRSQQFHPWYLTWVLVWLPLIKVSKAAKIWIPAILLLSISSLLRYLPYLYAGTFEGNVLWQQKMITWIPFGFGLLLFSLHHRLNK